MDMLLMSTQLGTSGRSYNSSKKKEVCAVELADYGKVKRFYTYQIPDCSAKLFQKMFDKHIDKEVKFTTDKWKG